jgi:hypothetical protein
MGEAKRRKAEIDALRRASTEWREGLTPSEVIIADVAERLHQRLVIERGFVGGCYHLAFFLRIYLRRQHGIDVTPIVGYVNDGTGPIMASHAWVEFNGKKTDLSLSRTEHAAFQPTGAFIVLDHVVRKGETIHTYHLERSAEVLIAEAELAKTGERARRAVEQKDAEHALMLSRVADDASIERYLAAAPANLNYEALAQFAT